MRCPPAQIPVSEPVHSTYCSLLLRPRALSSSSRKDRGSFPASSNAGCDTHRHYITVPSAPRRRLSEKEEGEEEGSFTGSRSARQLQPLQRAQAWKQAEGRKGAPSTLRGTACLSRQALPPLSSSSRQEVPIGWRGGVPFSFRDAVPSHCALSNNCVPIVPHSQASFPALCCHF